MQTDNRLFDDLARMANGALNTLSGVRDEFETRIRERVERLLADMDVVPREDFEAVRAMAQAARSEQEQLSAKVADLERRIEAMASAAPARRRSPARTTPGEDKPKRARRQAAEPDSPG